MAKIFIDTNIFLHFYDRNQPEQINDYVSELPKYAEHLFLVRQSQNEFLRNRLDVIGKYISQINKTSINVPISSFVANTEVGKKFILAQKEFKFQLNEIVKELKKLETQQDIILDLLDTLFSEMKTHVYEITDEIIEKAWRRKLAGNPPTSATKQTCGDEIIWESLLANCNDDLIIVSNDNTFRNNKMLLAKEFNAKTGKKLVSVENTFSNALRSIDITPTVKLEEAEKELNSNDAIEMLYDSSIGLVYIDKCGNAYPYCFFCNRYTKHSGVICLECGHKDCD